MIYRGFSRITLDARHHGGIRPLSTEELRLGCRILTGLPDILRARSALAHLAFRSGQLGELDSLEYFLTSHEALRKIPHLVLLGDHSPEGLYGAVLVLEYGRRLGRSRVVATTDTLGRRDVIAPPGDRGRIASMAARALIQNGSHVVHIAFSEASYGECDLRDNRKHSDTTSLERIISKELSSHNTVPIDGFWEITERECPAYLALYPTFDETLARIGQRTRSNMRYYRRRAELNLGARFESEPQISLSEFLMFNHMSSFPVTDSVATNRYNRLSLASSSFLMSLRDAESRLLSLVGGRHHDGYAEIDWQMNRTGLQSSSIGTVMRAYLIEHEVQRGSSRLYIDGGTSMSIAHSFVRKTVSELTLKRKSAYVQLLERFTPMLFPKQRISRIVLGRN